MTTPTPAQIEAFRQAMPSWWQRGAAQKKEETEEIIRALTAAAEVGEHSGTYRTSDGLLIKYTDKDLAETEAATIERCAQVVDEWMRQNKPWDLIALAAAIRELKDK